MENKDIPKEDIKTDVNKIKKNNLKTKIKELSDMDNNEPIVISFKFDEKMRKRLTTIVVLVVLVTLAFIIKYPERTIEIFGDLTKEELNSTIHMDNVLIYPDYNDIINNKSVFKDTYIYSEAIVLEKTRESEECYKLKVTFDAVDEKIGYLYYTENSKDTILLNEKISFVGKINRN